MHLVDLSFLDPMDTLPVLFEGSYDDYGCAALSDVRSQIHEEYYSG